MENNGYTECFCYIDVTDWTYSYPLKTQQTVF